MPITRPSTVDASSWLIKRSPPERVGRTAGTTAAPSFPHRSGYPLAAVGDRIRRGRGFRPDDGLLELAVFLPLHVDHAVSGLKAVGFGGGVEFDRTVEGHDVHGIERRFDGCGVERRLTRWPSAGRDRRRIPRRY